MGVRGGGDWVFRLPAQVLLAAAGWVAGQQPLPRRGPGQTENGLQRETGLSCVAAAEDKVTPGRSCWAGLTQRSLDRKEATQTREVSHCVLS